jgi:SAM-dependent methyltransferase
MREDVTKKLLAINREFYGQFAKPFAETRATPQPGFYRLLDGLPQSFETILDVGCGEGRLGRFLSGHSNEIKKYIGVDFSPEMLQVAESTGQGEFYLRDLSRPDCLDGLGSFPVIACLATLQHIPSRINRLGLLKQMAGKLLKDGRIVLSNWQFLGSDRQRRKVVSWKTVGLSTDELESGDYLLSWQRDGYGLRYVNYIGIEETMMLANQAGLEVFSQFRSDGREGNLNLYTILKLQGT